MLTFTHSQDSTEITISGDMSHLTAAAIRKAYWKLISFDVKPMEHGYFDGEISPSNLKHLLRDTAGCASRLSTKITFREVDTPVVVIRGISSASTAMMRKIYSRPDEVFDRINTCKLPGV